MSFDFSIFKNIDFSVLKNIDFTNKENLMFLGIIFVLGIVLLFAIFEAVRIFFKILKKIVIRIFNIEVRHPELNQKATDQLHEKNVIMSKPKIVGDVVGFRKLQEQKEENLKSASGTTGQMNKEKKSISEHLEKLKSAGQVPKETLESKMPSRVSGQSKEIKIPVSKFRT